MADALWGPRRKQSHQRWSAWDKEFENSARPRTDGCWRFSMPSDEDDPFWLFFENTASVRLERDKASPAGESRLN